MAYSSPKITRSEDDPREWVHPVAPLFYLHQLENLDWIVIDRARDIPATKPYRNKKTAVNAFIKQWKKENS